MSGSGSAQCCAEELELEAELREKLHEESALLPGLSGAAAALRSAFRDRCADEGVLSIDVAMSASMGGLSREVPWSPAPCVQHAPTRCAGEALGVLGGPWAGTPMGEGSTGGVCGFQICVL